MERILKTPKNGTYMEPIKQRKIHAQQGLMEPMDLWNLFLYIYINKHIYI